MKTTFFSILASFLFAFLPNESIAQKVNDQSNNYANLAEIESVRKSDFSEIPAFIKFRKNQEITVGNLNQWMQESLKISTDMGLMLIRSEKDGLGHVHYRYQQTYLDKPIEDAIWIAHTKDNQIYSLNGLIYKKMASSASQSLTEEAALTKALEFVHAETYKWELSSEEQHLKWESGNPDATYLPKAELVFLTAMPNFEESSSKLVYKFNIYAVKPLYRAELYVDATTGEVLRENHLIHHVDEPGTGHTVYSGEREIIADSFGSEFRLRDGSRGGGIRTFDMNNSTEHGDAVDFVDDDNDWNNINPQQDEYATDAHWGAEMTYDYFLEEHGRNSLDDAGFQLNSYVHYGSGFFNAFWDGERMTYGDGDGAPSTPLTTLDIAGHEISHGMTAFTADLIYSSESGALNESFSDIFGTAVENYARPADYNWLLGDEIGVTGRSMSNPNDFDCPDTYEGDLWDDFEEVHTNSGVQNFWYYLLTEGGSGTNDNGDVYDVTALGFDASSAIAFRNLTVYLTPSSNYADARFYAIQSAVDLYGGCTFEVEQTTNAWYAVGIGAPYSAEVIALFSAPEITACSLPFTVDFENESANGVDFVWDFGDDETSTEINPSHTYTEEGTYDVKLSVDGGICGEDEIIFTGYITIELEDDCPNEFPTSGSSTLTNCEGKVFDSGGSLDDYGANESGEVTISPVGAETVELTFIEFDVDFEFDFDCFFDFLTVYDGPSTSDPVIGTYCNDNPPPATLSSTGPSITMAFNSDADYHFGGFEIDWECIGEIDNSGIDELGNDQIAIYPNPSNGFMTIRLNTPQTGFVEVTDIIGKRIVQVPFTGNTVDIDLTSKSAKGLYLIHIRDQKGNLLNSQKVVLQ